MERYDFPEDDFIQIWNEAATAREVADLTGMNLPLVYAWGRRLDLPRHKHRIRRPPPSRKDEYIEAWSESSSLAEAAQKLGISPAGARVAAARLRGQGIELKSMTPPRISRQYMAGRLETANIELRDRGTFKAPRVRLGISDEVVKAAIIAKFGGHPARLSITWESQEGILALLTSVAPYMIERQAQAQELIDWIEGRQK